MRRIATILAPLALALIVVAPGASLNAASPATVRAGYWEYKIKAGPITVDTEYWCVKPAQIDKFFNGPCNRHHTCVYPTRVVADGKARFAGYWQNDEGKRANIDASGTYNETRFILKTKPTRGTNGIPIPGMTIDAKWLGETCKPGAKTPK